MNLVVNEKKRVVPIQYRSKQCALDMIPLKNKCSVYLHCWNRTPDLLWWY